MINKDTWGTANQGTSFVSTCIAPNFATIAVDSSGQFLFDENSLGILKDYIRKIVKELLDEEKESEVVE